MRKVHNPAHKAKTSAAGKADKEAKADRTARKAANHALKAVKARTAQAGKAARTARNPLSKERPKQGAVPTSRRKLQNRLQGQASAAVRTDRDEAAKTATAKANSSAR